MTPENAYKLINKLAAGPCRVTINQPSTSNIHHKYHGCRVLSIPPVIYARNGKYVRVYFTDGVVISMNVEINNLREGW